MKELIGTLSPGCTLREIQSTHGKYYAGSDGHIYCYSNSNVCRRRPCPFRVSEHIASTGYPFIGITLDGRKRSQLVHSWICEAFNGPKPDPKYVVRHLDGVKTNNTPDNLRWGSYSENEADKRRHGTVANGERQGSAILTKEAVTIIRAAIPCGLWNTVDAAKVFGVSPGHIAAIARGKGWKHLQPADHIGEINQLVQPSSNP